jgi:tripartite-type tricarboxylate transporter receptor subunit TctC
MIRRSATTASVAALVAAALACAHPAAAQSGGDFKGKQVELLIGSDPGGEYDLLARLLARHYGRHLPGEPNVVPRNMPGGGGIKSALYLYNVPAKDGTSIGVIQNNLPGLAAIHDKNVPIDFTTLGWLGTISPAAETMTVWYPATHITKFEELRTKEVIAGGTGRTSITYLYPTMMNMFLGTRFKVVAGYSSGNSINLAMEKGEVQARNNTWSSWKSTHPDWIKDGTIRVLTQAGPKAPDLPGVPTLAELAKSDDDRAIMNLVTSGAYLGRPFATPGGVAPARVKMMAAAFDETMKDPQFLDDARKLKVDVDPVKGEALHDFVVKLAAFPGRLVPQTKELLGE